MNVAVVAAGVTIAIAAAVRSTWSPCGLSMLAQITPIAETGRGQRFARTAAWFVAGAALGGLCLGGLMALGAIAVRATGIGDTAAIALMLAAALVAAAVDARVLGSGPPFLRRQVNENWLSNYRSWVYGAGFGWQIGTGVATYVMTAAVFLAIVIGVTSASPSLAIAIGCTFGVVRGLAVLIGFPLRTTAALLEFHRRFDAWSEPVRRAVIAVQLGVAVVLALLVAPAFVAASVSVVAVCILAVSVAPDRNGSRHARVTRAGEVAR
ncbi:MAG TPA: hypothetical protein VL119_12020 [Acidimicrobiia bacterium]|nr:hypothetical protein [Acidimicrobiia bacterium]